MGKIGPSEKAKESLPLFFFPLWGALIHRTEVRMPCLTSHAVMADLGRLHLHAGIFKGHPKVALFPYGLPYLCAA